MLKKLTVLGVSAVVVGGLSAPSASAATTVCTGVSGCKVVSTADVDGDGRRDQVGIVSKRSSSNYRTTVRVRTAKKRLMTTSFTSYWYHARPWHGAAKMDDRNGHELVIGQSAGAHSQSFKVLTYRNGKLTTLKDPFGDSTWFIDSSYSWNAGWFRTTSRGKVYMTSKYSSRRTSSTHDLSTYKFRAVNGTWKRVSSSHTTRASDKTVNSIGGWHVSGLKLYSR